MTHTQDRIDAQTELNNLNKFVNNCGEYMRYALLVTAIIAMPYALSHYAQSRIKAYDTQKGVTVMMSSIPEKYWGK